MQLRTVTARYGRKRQPAQYESAEAVIEFTLSVDEDGSIGQLDTAYQNIGIALLGTAKSLVLTELGVIKAGDNASAWGGAAPISLQATATSVQALNTGPGEAGGTPAVAEKTAAQIKAEKQAAKDAEKAEKQAAKEAVAAAEAAAKAQGATADTSAAGIPMGDDKPAAAKPETALGRALPVAETKKVETQAANSIPLGDPVPSTPVATPQQAAAVATASGEEVTASGVSKFITTCMVAKKFLPAVVLGRLKDKYKVDRIQDLSAAHLAEFYAWAQKVANGEATD